MMASRGRRYAVLCAASLLLWVGSEASIARAQGPAERTASESTKPDVAAKAEDADPKRAKLLADTHRMLILSRQIQAEMAKNGPDTLALGTVKKVEELQKLAAAVKAEMAKTK